MNVHVLEATDWLSLQNGTPTEDTVKTPLATSQISPSVQQDDVVTPQNRDALSPQHWDINAPPNEDIMSPLHVDITTPQNRNVTPQNGNIVSADAPLSSARDLVATHDSAVNHSEAGSVMGSLSTDSLDIVDPHSVSEIENDEDSLEIHHDNLDTPQTENALDATLTEDTIHLLEPHVTDIASSVESTHTITDSVDFLPSFHEGNLPDIQSILQTPDVQEFLDAALESHVQSKVIQGNLASPDLIMDSIHEGLVGRTEGKGTGSVDDVLSSPNGVNTSQSLSVQKDSDVLTANPHGLTDNAHVSGNPHGLSEICHEKSGHSHGLSENPHRISEKPKENVRNPHGIVDNPHGMLDNPHGIVENPHEVVEIPHGIVENLHGVVRDAHGVVENPHGIVENPYRIVGNPHGLPKPMDGGDDLVTAGSEGMDTETNVGVEYICHPESSPEEKMEVDRGSDELELPLNGANNDNIMTMSVHSHTGMVMEVVGVPPLISSASEETEEGAMASTSAIHLSIEEVMNVSDDSVKLESPRKKARSSTPKGDRPKSADKKVKERPSSAKSREATPVKSTSKTSRSSKSEPPGSSTVSPRSNQERKKSLAKVQSRIGEYLQRPPAGASKPSKDIEGKNKSPIAKVRKPLTPGTPPKKKEITSGPSVTSTPTSPDR